MRHGASLCAQQLLGLTPVGRTVEARASCRCQHHFPGLLTIATIELSTATAAEPAPNFLE